ncbi:MAG: hypothetical protein LBI82_13725 [Dysgonamonadaceae bacterium]|jgi:hypothetical protein|nr:hypothetical protein [Dysgonamonadaceae bacterium]
MGLFDKLFGKKQVEQSTESKTVQLQKGDLFISTGDNVGFKIIRPLTEQQRELIDKSTIQLRTGQLFMHYWTDNLVCTDRNDPEWQNKVMFFWRAEEPFPKKSLPSHFETFKVKHFLLSGDTSKVSFQVGQAMPWFEMPGLGEKHACEINGEKVTIPELNKLGLVEYIEFVELTDTNSDILTNRNEHFFLIDDRITPFYNGNFYLQGKPISIDMAYSIGGIHIIRQVELEK